jgi:hypothetical protein
MRVSDRFIDAEPRKSVRNGLGYTAITLIPSGLTSFARFSDNASMANFAIGRIEPGRREAAVGGRYFLKRDDQPRAS